MAKINRVLIGESLVGDGNEVRSEERRVGKECSHWG